MSRICAGLLMSAALSLVSATAFAGPVEQLDTVSINPADPTQMIVTYRYGGGGMFISRDGGKKFEWLCSAGVATTAVNRNGRAYVSGDGSIYLGLFDGLMKGGGDGCGFAAIPELDKKYIADVTGDPVDPKRTYIVTTNPNVDNYVYLNDGSGTFTPFGTPVKQFLDSIDVVKNGEGRRFYITGVLTDAKTNMVQYSVRVSDDDAKTWTEEPFDMAQFPPTDMYAEFSIVAISPLNPDHIIGRIWRKSAVDTLVYSTEKGKAGSWKLLAEPTEAEAVTFTPDGVLYFGDSDQMSKGLFVADKLGDAPRLLTDGWKPMCLGYDQANKRLLACSNYYLFGSVDTTTGALTPLLDLRCAEHMVECAGQPEMVGVCEPQALADFCNLSHWVLAPVCDVYDRGPDLATYVEQQTIMCVNGLGVPKVEGAPATGAAGAAAAGSGATAMSTQAVMAGAASGAAGMTSSPMPMPTPKSSGCSALPGAPSRLSFGWLLLGLGTCVAAARLRRRRGK
ncbi:MAG TPA: hypothetical protein VFN67_24800 [Polyangiales bacterium]|nr:hypothetical protein [Polyangiales bacterium]